MKQRTTLINCTDNARIIKNSILNKWYTVMSILGEGAASIVYKAVDNTGNLCALKECYPLCLDYVVRCDDGRLAVSKSIDFIIDFEQKEKTFNLFKERMKQEFENAQNARVKNDTNSPYICEQREPFEYNNTLYSEMAYSDGDTVYSLLNPNGSHMNKTEFLAVSFPAVCEAVKYLHTTDECNKYTLHLDISPSNIYIEKRSEKFSIYMLDFNSAVTCSTDKIKAAAVKSSREGFSAPEVINASRGYSNNQYISRASDTYSLCAVLFWVLLDRAPTWDDLIFTDKYEAEIINRYRKKYNLQLVHKICSILRKGLSQSIDKRYCDCSALIEDYRPVVTGILHYITKDNSGINSDLLNCVHDMALELKKKERYALLGNIGKGFAAVAVSFAVIVLGLIQIILAVYNDSEMTKKSDHAVESVKYKSAYSYAASSFNWFARLSGISKKAYGVVTAAAMDPWWNPDSTYIECTENLQIVDFISETEIAAVTENGIVIVFNYPQKEMIYRSDEAIPSDMKPISILADNILCLSSDNKTAALYQIKNENGKQRKVTILENNVDNICTSLSKQYIAISSDNIVTIYGAGGLRTNEEFRLPETCKNYNAKSRNFSYSPDDGEVCIALADQTASDNMLYYKVTKDSYLLEESHMSEIGVPLKEINDNKSKLNIAYIPNNKKNRISINVNNKQITRITGKTGSHCFDVSETDNIVVGVFGGSEIRVKELDTVSAMYGSEYTDKIIGYVSGSVKEVKIIESADGLEKYLYVIDDTCMRVFNVKDIANFFRYDDPLPGREINIANNCYSISNNYVAAENPQTLSIDIYDFSGEYLHTVDTQNTAIFCNINNKGELIIADGNFKVYTYEHYADNKCTEIHLKDSASSVNISSNGEYITQFDWQSQTLTMYDRFGKKTFENMISKDEVNSVVFTPDSTYCVGMTDHQAIIIKGNKIIQKIDLPDNPTVPVLTNESIIVSADNKKYLWDIESGTELLPGKLNLISDGYSSASVDPDARYICFQSVGFKEVEYNVVRFYDYKKLLDNYNMISWR